MKFLLALSVSVLFSGVLGWGSTNKDRVLLTDVKAITLYNGQMTTGRRTSPVPQLSCIGGTAGCYGSHQPRTVQCLNRGSDGMDVQWECKATLDDEYQFGRIRVVCEGYDSPEDPYVLKGSCGLEYELDYTAKNRQGNSYHGSNHQGGSNTKSSAGFSGLIQLVVVVAIIYFLCSCIRKPRQQGQPPSGYGDTNYGSSSGGATGTNTGAGGGPGFWTGAATGGALGYLFGNRRNTGYGRNYGGWGSTGGGWGSTGGGWGSGRGGWGSGGGGWGSGGSSRSSSSSSSSRSRSTSGFGGTGRR